MDRYRPPRNTEAQAPRRGADDDQGYGADFRPDEARGADDARSGPTDVYRGHEEYSRGRGVWMPNEAGGGMASYSGRRGQFAGRGPRNYTRPDESIQDEACQWLSANPELDASDIEVHVQNGQVTLSGTVGRRREKHLAEDIVESVSGVREVRNEIRVRNAQERE
jgi:hypothetical protein